MANTPVKIWGKFSQYALEILDFTLNMPHEILGPVAPPTLKDQEYLTRDTGRKTYNIRECFALGDLRPSIARKGCSVYLVPCSSCCGLTKPSGIPPTNPDVEGSCPCCAAHARVLKPNRHA